MNTAPATRRSFLAKALMALAGGWIGGKALAAEEKTAPSSLDANGDTLKTHMVKGKPPVEPLDTMMLFERSDNNTERAMTHEILSLIHEEKGNKSYPWTIYSHLTTSHVEGDACVLCSRLTKNGPGWSAGLHSEVFSYARAVALGVNIEMSNHYTGSDPTLIIGLNIQAAHGNPCQYGIQVHDGDSHWEKAIGLNGKGQVGLDLGGKFDVGINAHDNSIRVNEGTCIELDGEGKIRLRYKAGRIEFLNGDKCVGHIRVDGEDHEV